LLGPRAHGDLLEDVRFSEPERKKSALAEVERLRFGLPRAEPPPEIDGDLTDPCWQQPPAYLGKFRLGLTALPARHSREAWATYDDRFLYFGVKLQREPGTELRVLTRENDNPEIWEDDELEIFLDPFNTGTEYFQFIVNSERFVYDAAHSYRVVADPRGASPTDTRLKRETDADWSSGLLREVSIHDEYWSAEMALPLTSIGLSGAPPGHLVGFNITSADWDTEEYTCLSPTSNWHDPRQFGVLALGQPRLAVTQMDFGAVGAGTNRLRLAVRDLSGRPGDYTLLLVLTTEAGKAKSTTDFSLDAGGRQRVSLLFAPWGSTALDLATWRTTAVGPWEAHIQIADSTGQPVFAARRAGTLPDPLTMRLKSHATFTDGRPVIVSARIGFGGVTARRVILEVRLLDAHGRTVASQNLGATQGSILTAWLPVDELQPGAYRLQLSAVSDGQVAAQAEDELRVAASPFADRQ
jgi:hypothetical protein